MRFVAFCNVACCALLAFPLGAAAQQVKVESQGEAFVATEAKALVDTALARHALGQPPAGKAHVVFFRPGKSATSAPTLDVYDGGVDVGDLGSGSYFVATVRPGAHAFGFDAKPANPLRLTVRSGRTLYVKAAKGRDTTGRPILVVSNASAFLAAASQDRK